MIIYKKTIEYEEKVIKKEEELKKLEEAKELQKQEQKKRGIKVKKGQKNEPEQNQTDKNDEFDFSFLDAENLENSINTIKYCLEHLSKLVIVLVSYDQPLGRYRKLSSVKFFHDILKTV